MTSVFSANNLLSGRFAYISSLTKATTVSCLLIAVFTSSNLFAEPLAESRWLVEAIKAHNVRGYSAAFRDRFGSKQATEVAKSLEQQLDQHKGSLGKNNELKSYVLSNNSWLLGQILFKETTLFYQIRAINGKVYDLELQTSPEVFNSAFMSDIYSESSNDSHLINKLFNSSTTLDEFYEGLNQNLNTGRKLEVPAISAKFKLEGIEKVTSFTAGENYTKYLYLVEGERQAYTTCHIYIYQTKDGREMVNGYSCNEVLTW